MVAATDAFPGPSVSNTVRRKFGPATRIVLHGTALLPAESLDSITASPLDVPPVTSTENDGLPTVGAPPEHDED